ncbi:MAG: hypothetical protein LKE52_04140 [Bacilli bacterium]|nr:hypothetical protein [Bacilli bacterium]
MYKTKGSANFKLNVNSTTGDQWNKFFGTSGSVYAHSSSAASNYVSERESKFYLSNSDFLDFLKLFHQPSGYGPSAWYGC